MNTNKKKNEHIAAGQKLLLTTFNEQARLKLEQGSHKTAKNYRSTISKIEAYLTENADGDNTLLYHIDSHWVHDFASWLFLRHPGKPGTVGFYLSNFKAMYNRAVELGETSYPASGYPFTHISVKVSPPFKRALMQQDVQQLSQPINYNQLTSGCRESLDLFLFIFFCQGINFHDVYTLTYDQIDSAGYITYIRSKTGVQLKVKLTDEMNLILSRYRKPDSPLLFPFLREQRRKKTPGVINEDSALKRTNRHLKKIGKLLKIDTPLTTYVMRHTFATLMLDSGAAIELISQCLGHTSIITTQIYLSKLTTEKLDKATDNMIKMYVRQPEKEEETTTPPKSPPQKHPRRKVSKKIEVPCQTETIEEKKCPSLTKKRTFGDLLVSITTAKVIKTFHIKKLEWHTFFVALHNIMLFFTKHVFQNGVNLS